MRQFSHNEASAKGAHPSHTTTGNGATQIALRAARFSGVWGADADHLKTPEDVDNVAGVLQPFTQPAVERANLGRAELEVHPLSLPRWDEDSLTLAFWLRAVHRLYGRTKPEENLEQTEVELSWCVWSIT